MATWCTGEFADLLITGCPDLEPPFSVTEDEVIDLFQTALTSPVCNLQTREMIVSAIMKLSVRFSPSHLA